MAAAEDERLRQEREAFDLNKGQSIGWFRLQIATSCVVLFLLIGVAGVSCHILLNGDAFTDLTVAAAAAALFGDVVSLAVIFVRLILSPAPRPGLAPVSASADPSTNS